MHKLRLLLPALLALAVTVCGPRAALAEDDEDSGDSGESSDDSGDTARGGTSRTAAKPTARVREVVKGFYARAGVGFLAWLPPVGLEASGVGNSVDLALGGDIVDQLGFTLSVEGQFFQGVSNGPPIPGVYLQGDFRSIGGLGRVRAGLNFGGRQIKRWTFFFGGGGGVYYSPQLQPEMVGTDAAVNWIHGKPAGMVAGNVGIEFYTKLSHFSLGLDASFYAVLGLPVTALSLSPTIFFKYTF